MNAGTIIVMIILAVVVGAVIVFLARDRKRRKISGCCSMGCGGCAQKTCAVKKY